MSFPDMPPGSRSRGAALLTAYIAAALRRAHYEPVPGQGGYVGTIPGLDGVWAEAPSLEECRDELQEVLEEWIVLGLRMGHSIPPLDGISLTILDVA